MKKNILKLLYLTITIIVVTLTACGGLQNDYISVKHNCDSIAEQRNHLTYPSGASYKKIALNKGKSLKSLKQALDSGDFDRARRCYFGDITYDGNLPDIICYVKKDTVSIGMSHSIDKNIHKRGGQDKSSVLWGKTRVWVLIFSDNDLNNTEIMRTVDTVQLQKIKDSLSALTNKPTLLTSRITGITPSTMLKRTYDLLIEYSSKNAFDTTNVKALEINISHSKLKNSTKVSYEQEILYGIKQDDSILDVRSTDISLINKTIANYPKTNFHFSKFPFDTLTKITLSGLRPPQLDSIKKLVKRWYSGKENIKFQKKDSIFQVSKDSAAPKTYTITLTQPPWIIKRQALEYQQQPGEFSLSNIISTIASIFIKTPLPSSSSLGNPLQDSSSALGSVVKLMDAKGQSGDIMYASQVSFNIAPNTKNRITIIPMDTTYAFHSITYNFGNFETTHVTAGLGVGINYNPFADHWFAAFNKAVGLDGRNPRQPDNDNFAKFYVFGHYYLSRPELPVIKHSWSLVLGTNISTTNPLQDIVFGIRYGYEHFGFTVAGNYMVYDDQARGLNGLISFDYQL